MSVAKKLLVSVVTLLAPVFSRICLHDVNIRTAGIREGKLTESGD